jgi:hypothetical protein
LLLPPEPDTVPPLDEHPTAVATANKLTTQNPIAVLFIFNPSAGNVAGAAV